MVPGAYPLGMEHLLESQFMPKMLDLTESACQGAVT